MTTPRTLVRVASLALLLLLVGGLGGSTAQAHSGDQSYLYLQITEDVRAEVHLPFADLNEHLGLDLDTGDSSLDDDIDAARSVLVDYARSHVAISSGGQPWSIGDADDVARFRNTDYVTVSLDVDLRPEDVPNVLEVTFDPFFDEDNTRDALFLIFNDFERGFVDNEADPLARFTPGNRTQTIDIGDRSWTKNFRASIDLGIDHIKTGPDHMLFVAVLLLPSVLVFSGGWWPTERFAGSLWRVLKIVTMFTIAHSITLTLAGLDLIPLPGPRLVESIIALSIAAAALHNIRPIAPHREWLIAFGFGLFHGLGFASLVQDLQVSRSTQIVSLLGRNVGIEIGQALVVLLVFPALFLLRRTRAYMPLFTIGSWALVVISLGWLTERLFDAPAATSRLVNWIVAYPRVLVFVAVATAISAAYHWYERERGLLLAVKPVSEPEREPSPEPVPVER